MKHHNDKIKVGISSCLLGNRVRWNAKHKHDYFFTEILSQYFDYIPVCPEVECGLGVPRETLKLKGNWRNPLLMTTNTKIDLTDLVKKWAAKKIKQLDSKNLCGFIFKSGSPSCGMQKIKVYPDCNIVPVKKGVGIFAKAFMEHFSNIPVKENEQLHNPNVCENFIEQVFTMKRRQDVLSKKRAAGYYR